MHHAFISQWIQNKNENITILSEKRSWASIGLFYTSVVIILTEAAVRSAKVFHRTKFLQKYTQSQLPDVLSF